MEVDEKLHRALREPLSKDVVKTREAGGQRLSYLEGWYVIDEANKVFGPGGWDFTVLDRRVVHQYERATKRGTNLVMLFEAHVRVTVHGIVREDVGVGVCDAPTDNPAAGIEKALKEAITDGLKRCFRTFGYRFGLALYDKEREHVGGSAESLRLLADLAEAPDDGLEAWWRRHVDAVKALDEGEAAAVRSAVAERRRAAVLARLEGELASVETPEALRACWADNAPAITQASDGNALLGKARELLCDHARKHGWARTKAEVDALLGKGEGPASPAPAPEPAAAPLPPKKPYEAPAVTEDRPLEPGEAPEPQSAAMESFVFALEQVETPSAAVDLWIRHRAALAKLDAADRERAWKLICARVEKVGKLKNAKAWLKRAVAEKEALAGRPGGDRVSPDDGPRGGGAPRPAAPANDDPEREAIQAESAAPAPTMQDVHRLRAAERDLKECSGHVHAARHYAAHVDELPLSVRGEYRETALRWLAGRYPKAVGTRANAAQLLDEHVALRDGDGKAYQVARAS